MLIAILLALFAIPTLPDAQRQLTFDIYKQLIETNTTESSGNMTTAADAMAKRLLDAGFPKEDVQVLAPEPRHGNLVARLRGSGKEKPLLLLAHLDVVEARREDWSTDPFTLVEKDGFYYGRGTGDDKAMAAIWIATLIASSASTSSPIATSSWRSPRTKRPATTTASRGCCRTIAT